jgi:type IV secretory pathway VirB2 component (pilin)
MYPLFKKIYIPLLITLASFLSLMSTQETFADCGWFKFGACEVKIDIKCPPGWCKVENGVSIWQKILDPTMSKKTFSQFAQDIVVYLLSFVTIIAVIYIIYAGFQVLIGAGDEEKLKKAKNIILYVALGIIIMWLSYSIVAWIIALITKVA